MTYGGRSGPDLQEITLRAGARDVMEIEVEPDGTFELRLSSKGLTVLLTPAQFRDLADKAWALRPPISKPALVSATS